MAEPFLAGYLAVETSVRGILTGGTRMPMLLYDPDTGDTILRPLVQDADILFQNADGTPLAIDVSVDFSNVQNTPTTLLGYGIADAYSETEVDTLLVAKVPTSRQVTAGTGLTGGGALSADQSLVFDTTWGDARYAALVHEHAAADITSGVFGLDRGGLSFDTIAQGELIYASAADTLAKLAGAATDGWVLTWDTATGLPEWAAPTGGVDDAFAEIQNSAGVMQFAASGADGLQFAAGSDLAVAFDAGNNRVTFSYVGGGAGGVTAAWSTMAVGGSSVTATGADTFTFAGAGGMTPSLDVGAKTITYTLGNHSAALLTTGTLLDALVQESNVTQHEAALSIGISQLDTIGTADGTTFLRGDGAWTAVSGVDEAGDYDWTGMHTFSSAIAGTAGNGYLDLKGDTAGSTFRLSDAGHLGLGTDIESWAGYRAIEGPGAAVVFGTANRYLSLYQNSYYDGTGAGKYKTTNAAASLLIGDGAFTFQVAASGTADTAVSWTTPLFVSSAGQIGINETSFTGFSSFRAIFRSGSSYSNGFAIIGGSSLGFVVNDSTNVRNNFIINDSGAATLHGGLTQNASDARLKTGVETWGGALDLALALRPVEYDWLPDAPLTGHDYGYIAQEVAESAPWLVKEREDGYLTLYWERIGTTALAAVRGEHEWNQTEHDRFRSALQYILDHNPELHGREKALEALTA